MKIAMVTPRYVKDIRGGGERSCRLLVEALRVAGVQVDVFSGDELFPEIQDTKYLNLAMYRYLRKITNEYDIFHTYNMSLLPIVGLLTRRYGINSVASLNGHVFSPTFERQLSNHKMRSYLLSKFLTESLIRHINRFTTLGEFWKDAWVKDGIAKEKIQVIPNMIEKKFPSYRTRLNSTVNLLAVGNCVGWRDLKTTLDAYAKLPPQDITLTVVGQGWEDTVMNYKGRNVLLYCKKINQERLNELYSEADIYIQSYKYNGIGRAMLEACQYKSAIVTTGTLRDFPHLHGYLNYFKGAGMLKNTLQVLIDNEGVRKDQGENVCKIVNKYFTPENTASKYIELYKEVLNVK